MARKNNKSYKFPFLLLDCFKQGDLLFGLTGSRNHFFYALDMLGHQYYSANHLNIPLVEQLLGHNLTENAIENLPKQKRSHAKFLLKHQTILTKPGGKDPWSKATAEEKKRAIVIRRACKLLVKTVKANQDIGRVHFLLDGINMQRVCSRQTSDNQIDNSITSGELRAAFRTRWANRNSIFFYENGQRVLAPWDRQEYRALWNDYEKGRISRKK